MAKTLRQQVYDSILSSILNGEYGVDDVLTEKAMIEKFGCSKSPVRDALVSLCSDHILESIPRYGYRPVRYDAAFYEGIQRFRQINEPRYLEDRWEHIREEDICILEKVEQSFLNDPERDSPLVYWRHNCAFHVGLANMLHDAFYAEMLEQAMLREQLVFVQHYWHRWDRTIFEDYTSLHSDILAALRDGDREAAVRCLAEDIATFIQF